MTAAAQGATREPREPAAAVQEEADDVGSPQWQEAMFTDGEFRKPAGGGTIGVRDKASGEIFATAGLAGMVHVNDATPQDEALAPFGDIGQSGLGGRSGDDSGIEEFTERRWLTITPGPAHYPY